MAALLALLLFSIVLAAMITYGTLSWAFVIFKFYYWFIHPVFLGSPELVYLECIGIYLFVRIFTFHANPIKFNDDLIKEDNSMFYLVMGPWIIFTIGWLFSLVIT